MVLTERDSVRTEYIETVRIDTVRVTVTVPEQSCMAVVPDSTSHLETSFAESDAWINPDGTLGHTLTNKPQTIEAEALVPVKDTASTTTASGVREVPVPYPQPFPVERELTEWERFRLSAFWYLVTACSAAALWIFRSPLLSLVYKICKRS